MLTELFSDDDRAPADLLLARLKSATAGSYDVAGELGRGGMAVVYVGTDRQLQRRVALKVMDPRLAMTQGMAARFLQEARIAARLQHPNIIVVHDVRHSDEIIFFVMSLIDGVAVDEICRRTQPIPIDQIRWILLQATRALAYAHSEDIVHRDIKPANILLNLKGDVILTDFGIAKALGDTGLTQSGTQIGTPMYMSPEQFSGAPVGAASDQYALGITAYEMLAGKPPFSGDLYQLIASHGGRAPEPVQNLRPDCPPFLANAVMRMLEKNPDDRWPSLDDLLGVFGANMAIDGGVARRKLAETVQALHIENGGSASRTTGSGASTPPKVTQAPISLVVTISPPGATIFVSGTLDLRATVSLDTGQSMPGTSVQWTSSDESVLRVDNNGQLTGVAPGMAVVRATVNGGFSEATIRVEAAPIARLSMTTPSITMRVGDVISPNVTAVDVNGAARDDIGMVWISRAPAIADLDEPGRVRALSPGMAVIDVAIGNVRRSIDVAVLRRPIAKLTLSAATRALNLGDSMSFSLEAFDDLGQPADASPVRWASSAPSVIHIDSTGRALAIGPGTARISASVDEATDTIEVESLEAAIGTIHLAAVDSDVELGDEVTWTMRVKDVQGGSRSPAGVRVWSSAPDIVSIDASGQRGLALHIGEATIYAAPDGRDEHDPLATSFHVRVTDVIVDRLELFPASMHIEVGSVAAVSAQAVDRRGRQMLNTALTWSVDQRNIAVVEGNGIVRAIEPGSCVVTARTTNSDGTVVEASLAVRVRQASIARLSIASDRSMIEVGETISLRATTWDSMEVEVRDAVPTWKSTHPSVARVEGDGKVTALAPGRVTITAELEGKSGQLALLVAPSAMVSLEIGTINDPVVGVMQQLSVTGVNRTGQTVSPQVRWHVTPPEAATVTPAGAFTPRRAGAMTVRATLIAPSDAEGLLSPHMDLEATADVQARDAKIVSLAFDTPSVKLAVGRSRRVPFQAKSESGGDIAATALPWVSSKPDVVRVDAHGELTALAAGESQITVSADGKRASFTVQVVEGGFATVPRRTMAMAGGAVVVALLAWVMWPGGSESAQDVAVGAPMVSDTATVPGVTPETGAVGTAGDVAVAGDTVLPAGASPGVTPVTPPQANAGNTPRNTTTAPAPSPVAARIAAADSARNARLAAQEEAQRIADREAQRTATRATPPVTAPPSNTVVDTTVSRPPAYTPPVTPPPATPAPATVEIPTAGDLQTIAERVVRDAQAGRIQTTPELQQFFEFGADHKAGVGTAPGTAAANQGHVRTQFEMTLSRRNAGGILERRVCVVTIDVTKRNGAAKLESASFGAIVRPGSR